MSFPSILMFFLYFQRLGCDLAIKALIWQKIDATSLAGKDAPTP